MTRECPYCDDVLLGEHFDEHLQECIRKAAKEIPAPQARFQVTCSRVDCILNKGLPFDDFAAAEFLAFAHEQRNPWDDQTQLSYRHYVDVQELNKVQPSVKPGAPTGAQEAAHG